MNEKLKMLIRELESCEQYDDYGSSTYRVHIKTAKRLLQEAFNAGVESVTNTHKSLEDIMKRMVRDRKSIKATDLVDELTSMGHEEMEVREVLLTQLMKTDLFLTSDRCVVSSIFDSDKYVKPA
jgi:hypothetical protein